MRTNPCHILADGLSIAKRKREPRRKTCWTDPRQREEGRSRRREEAEFCWQLGSAASRRRLHSLKSPCHRVAHSSALQQRQRHARGCRCSEHTEEHSLPELSPLPGHPVRPVPGFRMMQACPPLPPEKSPSGPRPYLGGRQGINAGDAAQIERGRGRTWQVR